MPTENMVHLIDDDAAVLDSLGFLLETAGLAVTSHASAASFLKALPGLASGCIVTDVRMPGLSGLDLVRRLKADGVDQPVIVITGHADVPLAVEAMKAGVCDFLEKPFDDQKLVAAVKAALARQAEESHDHAERSAYRARLAALSEREAQVLQGLVSGLANKAIAYDLGISPRTVEIYRANVMTKMNAASLSDLVRMALLADAA